MFHFFKILKKNELRVALNILKDDKLKIKNE